ncbi:glycosyltransferase family 39 protein [Candidatus Daviesbacteria bacterium]|nr:glycosyltransferase family 39 protein [Candidatus Daviesbacteria bacterium]
MDKKDSSSSNLKFFQYLSDEMLNHKLIYLLLLITFYFGTWVRTANLDKLLGFYYDQGRDFLTVAKILSGKLTLIGPTTGIEGVFHGPLYYYLLAPMFAITGGDPAQMATMMGIFNSLAILLIFIAGSLFFNRACGLLAAFMFAISLELVNFSRWFSNPSPQMVFTLLALISLWMIAQKKRWGLPLLAFAASFGFQFEAVSLITIIPACLVLFIWQRNIWLSFDRRSQVLSVLIILIGLSPYILFELRHNFLMTNAAAQLIAGNSSFKLNFADVIWQRINFYLEVYNNLLMRDRPITIFLLVASFVIGIINLKRQTLSTNIKILLIWTASPLATLLFYHGNYGYVWGYYLSPTLPSVILLVSFSAYFLWQNYWLKIVVAIFLILFIRGHQPLLANFTSPDISYGRETIALGNQLQAIDWIYQDAKGQAFNADVYVPPVVPYAYDYLIGWYGRKNYHQEPLDKQVQLLYTLYEVDPPHPERLAAWLSRQKGIAPVIVRQASFGGITVERRQRLMIKDK